MSAQCGCLSNLFLRRTYDNHLPLLNIGIDFGPSCGLNVLDGGATLPNDTLDTIQSIDLLPLQRDCVRGCEALLFLSVPQQLLHSFLGKCNSRLNAGNLEHFPINVETGIRRIMYPLDGGALWN